MKQHGMRQVSYDTQSYNRLSRVGRETTNLVVGVHDGLRLRCALHEGPFLDIQR